MRFTLSHIAPLLAAGAAAVAIAAAPTAMAAAPPMGACTMVGGSPVCPNTHATLTSPPSGNSQINASPGPVGYAPQYPYDEGGYWGGYRGYGGYGGFGHGGFGGGGFGGGHGGGGGHGR